MTVIHLFNVTMTITNEVLDTIAPIDQKERESELHKIESAEAEIDKAYNDRLFWNKIANIMAEAKESTDESVEGRITSSNYLI